MAPQCSFQLECPARRPCPPAKVLCKVGGAWSDRRRCCAHAHLSETARRQERQAGQWQAGLSAQIPCHCLFATALQPCGSRSVLIPTLCAVFLPFGYPQPIGPAALVPASLPFTFVPNISFWRRAGLDTCPCSAHTKFCATLLSPADSCKAWLAGGTQWWLAGVEAGAQHRRWHGAPWPPCRLGGSLFVCVCRQSTILIVQRKISKQQAVGATEFATSQLQSRDLSPAPPL